jgi:hypothetical protein
MRRPISSAAAQPAREAHLFNRIAPNSGLAHHNLRPTLKNLSGFHLICISRISSGDEAEFENRSGGRRPAQVFVPRQGVHKPNQI